MGELEKLIADRFDLLAATFPNDIDRKDARLRALINSAGDIRGKKVLEVGCGKGRIARVFLELGADIHGIDISDGLLEEARKIAPSRFLMAGAYDIPFSDGTFDLVYLVEVIEHIPELERALDEIARVTKKDGKLIIIDRNILSFNNRRMFVPNAIIKRYHELKNEWMYPKDFPYREKWFLAKRVLGLFKKHFKRCGYQYLLSDGETRKWWHVMFRVIQQTRYFILWCGKDKTE